MGIKFLRDLDDLTSDFLTIWREIWQSDIRVWRSDVRFPDNLTGNLTIWRLRPTSLVTNFSNFGGFFSNFGGFFSNFGGMFSLKFENSCDFDCPDLRSGSHFFYILQVVVRRGHDEVMDSQSDFHRLRCRALRAVMLIVPISSDDGLNNHCQFWREVLKICAKIGKIHGVGAKIGLIGAKIHYSFCLAVMSASILLQDTKGLAWCYGVWHNFVDVKQKLARNLAKFHEFAPK